LDPSERDSHHSPFAECLLFQFRNLQNNGSPVPTPLISSDGSDKSSDQPSTIPFYNPSITFTGLPVVTLSITPSMMPTNSSSLSQAPSNSPSGTPSSSPSGTRSPTNLNREITSDMPSFNLSYFPTKSAYTSNLPSFVPPANASTGPTFMSFMPTATPSITPMEEPLQPPSLFPSLMKSSEPNFTYGPSFGPTFTPSNTPSNEPTISPSLVPTDIPAAIASLVPSRTPSISPTVFPTQTPSVSPTIFPTQTPSVSPTIFPTQTPSVFPTVFPTIFPSLAPTETPSLTPSLSPSSLPSFLPTGMPSTKPSIPPTIIPTNTPSFVPSDMPSFVPTDMPSSDPTHMPSMLPSLPPTNLPSTLPTHSPSRLPSLYPTSIPTSIPTSYPTLSQNPSRLPSSLPTKAPTARPTGQPSGTPTIHPTLMPSISPSHEPTRRPTIEPTDLPSFVPTHHPSNFPSPHPTFLPTYEPSASPTSIPTSFPSLLPTIYPSTLPTERPSFRPTRHPIQSIEIANAINSGRNDEVYSDRFVGILIIGSVSVVSIVGIFLARSATKELEPTNDYDDCSSISYDAPMDIFPISPISSSEGLNNSPLKLLEENYAEDAYISQLEQEQHLRQNQINSEGGTSPPVSPNLSPTAIGRPVWSPHPGRYEDNLEDTREYAYDVNVDDSHKKLTLGGIKNSISTGTINIVNDVGINFKSSPLGNSLRKTFRTLFAPNAEEVEEREHKSGAEMQDSFKQKDQVVADIETNDVLGESVMKEEDLISLDSVEKILAQVSSRRTFTNNHEEKSAIEESEATIEFYNDVEFNGGSSTTGTSVAPSSKISLKNSEWDYSSLEED